MIRSLRVATAAETRAADERASRELGIPAERLMTNAAAGALRVLEARYGDPLGYRVAIVCGKGNNGGDGLVLARLLARRGAVVTTLVAGRLEDLGALPRTQLELTRREGVAVSACASAEEFASRLGGQSFDFVIDALLGTGARGAPTGPVAAAVEAIESEREKGARVVALDLPSGLDADSGQPGSPCVTADLTVTFACLKPAHLLYPGRARCGSVEVVDIGLPEAAFACAASREVLTPAGAAALLPQRLPTAHKGTAGRALLVGGSMGMSGAVALAAESALRCGAGLVTAAVPRGVQPIVAALTAETVTVGLAESEGMLAAAALPALAERAADVRAVAFGPGLGRGEEIDRLTAAFLRDLRAPAVIDADGLFALSRVERWWTAAAAPRVLTPHLGEMSRLTGADAEALEARRLDVAAEWASQWGVVVLLKGAPTVVAAPDGRRTVNPTGNPGMASAGMGDVLTGCVLAYLTQGLEPYDAARLAAYLHGAAADRIVARRGPGATLAGEVARELSEVLGEWGRARGRADEGGSS